MSQKKKFKGLGKGLSALIPEEIEEEIIKEKEKEEKQEIDINKIKPNVLQARKHFDEKAIDALSVSIKRNGIIQALILRKLKTGYEIIAGERRWRAAKKAKLKTVPAIIMNLDEIKRYEISLIENMQRENLNAIEEALAYNSLLEEYETTHQEISEMVGKSRAYISNTLRLLKCSEKVQEKIIEKEISPGHAKILAGFIEEKQNELLDEILKRKLNVRDLEKIIKERERKEKTKTKENKEKKEEKEKYIICEEYLMEKLSTKVEIKDKVNIGEIKIEFYSEDDFNRIYNLLKKL